MRRIAVGMTVGLAVWFGSAVVAEAQWIQPTGPLSVVAGASSVTFTGTITVPTAGGMCVKLWVLKNGVEYNYSSTSIPNPGTTTYYFSKFVDTSAWGLEGGQVVTFRFQLLYNRSTYNFEDYNKTVQESRPPKTYQKSNRLALQAVDRDRRRE